MHKSNNVNDNNITNISSLISKQDKNSHILCIAHTHSTSTSAHSVKSLAYRRFIGNDLIKM